MNSHLSFTVTKRATPYAKNPKTKKVWRNFTVPGQITMEELEEISEYLGREFFEKSFKAKFEGENIRLVEGSFISDSYTKLTFACTEDEAENIVSFFNAKGVVAKVANASFFSKNKK